MRNLKLCTMPMFMVSTFILLTDLMMAVGPCLSAPCVGLIPSESGIQAKRPFGVAAVSSPIGVLLEIDRVPWLSVE
ncbi:hypothetical protein D3C80_1599800 [compost metagenome]